MLDSLSLLATCWQRPLRSPLLNYRPCCLATPSLSLHSARYNKEIQVKGHSVSRGGTQGIRLARVYRGKPFLLQLQPYRALSLKKAQLVVVSLLDLFARGMEPGVACWRNLLIPGCSIDILIAPYYYTFSTSSWAFRAKINGGLPRFSQLGQPLEKRYLLISTRNPTKSPQIWRLQFCIKFLSSRWQLLRHWPLHIAWSANVLEKANPMAWNKLYSQLQSAISFEKDLTLITLTMNYYKMITSKRDHLDTHTLISFNEWRSIPNTHRAWSECTSRRDTFQDIFNICGSSFLQELAIL